MDTRKKPRRTITSALMVGWKTRCEIAEARAAEAEDALKRRDGAIEELRQRFDAAIKGDYGRTISLTVEGGVVNVYNAPAIGGGSNG